MLDLIQLVYPDGVVMERDDNGKVKTIKNSRVVNVSYNHESPCTFIDTATRPLKTNLKYIFDDFTVSVSKGVEDTDAEIQFAYENNVFYKGLIDYVSLSELSILITDLINYFKFNMEDYKDGAVASN
jgi:hypothetical protein